MMQYKTRGQFPDFQQTLNHEHLQQCVACRADSFLDNVVTGIIATFVSIAVLLPFGLFCTHLW